MLLCNQDDIFLAGAGRAAAWCREWVRGGEMGEAAAQECRMGGKVVHSEHRHSTHRLLPWSSSQLDTAQNHGHQRQQDTVGTAPRTTKKGSPAQLQKSLFLGLKLAHHY